MVVNKVRVNRLDDSWEEVGEAFLIELTPISDGIFNGSTPTVGPMVIAANADGLTILYEGPGGTREVRINLLEDEEPTS